MCELTIQHVDDQLVQGLKRIAWQKGLTFEESVRQLLCEEVRARTNQERDLTNLIGEPRETD